VAELQRDPGLWLAAVVEEDRPAVEADWSRAVAGGVESDHLEYRIRRPDGTLRWIEASGFAVRGEGGRVRRMVGFARDITARKLAEQAQRELEQRMLLAQKTESLALLAGGVAHDFNNILTGILGHAELALSQLPLDAPARTHLTGIALAAQRAADLARQMLAYAGRGPLTPSLVDLGALVGDFGSLMAATTREKAQLRFEIAPDVPPVEADGTQLGQVVMNLVTNASEALGERGGVVTISTGVQECTTAELQDGPIREERAPGRYCYVEVSDDGEGMSEKTRARIFEPFFSTRFTGRGLGLAAVLGIVRGHHGSIHVRSAPGQGTAVRVLLPAAAAPAGAAAAAPREPSGTARSSAGGTILVVDDEETVRDVLAQMLTSAGYRALAVPDGLSALETVRQPGTQVDLVILDQTMPGMDGRETLQALRGIAPELPVILSSGYDGPQADPAPSSGPPLAFLHKPYRAASLFSAIEQTLRPGRRPRAPG
jgi:signal transduction histidine kinase/CheY-like chemotaxis protein